MTSNNQGVQPPTIAIIGAGLSGLVCARILQRNGVAVAVYEADPDAAARQQGGDLDIHSDTGQIALREAGLYEQFLANTIAGAEAVRVMDKTAHVFIDRAEEEGGNGRPEIKRTVLRELLIESVEPGTIHWGRKLVTVRATGSTHELHFADGSVAQADLVVGADGAWSRVRALLTDVRPQYTGVTMVEIRLSESAAKHPGARALAGDGSLFALSDNKYIGGHGGDEMSLALGMRVPEDWTTASGIDWENAPAAREALASEFADWAPEFGSLIRDCDDTIWPRQIYALPTGTTWQHVKGVTLAGDAAHLMSPFAGEGANLALIDGADLARAILAGGELDAALAAYEKKVVRRGAKSAAESARGLDMLFNDRAPKQLVRMFGTMFFFARLARPVVRLFVRSSRSPTNPEGLRLGKATATEHPPGLLRVATGALREPPGRARRVDGVTASVTTIRADLAPGGVLRVAINLGNPVLVQGTAAAPTGVTVDIARAIGERLGSPVQHVCCASARESFDATVAGDADLCFLAIEPARAAELTFTAPYAVVEGVFVVPSHSPFQRAADVDRPGVRIGVNQGAAYDLFLTRTLAHATVVRGVSGIDEFRDQGLDAAAGIRQPMADAVSIHPGLRMIADPFMQIQQAVATTNGHLRETTDFLHDTVEELKSSGFVAAALSRASQSDAMVAPPG
jgi:2-polyprenyl-6-methoxyphenol hydroxylase-like FAD-dependent oxidoreductase